MTKHKIKIEEEEFEITEEAYWEHFIRGNKVEPLSKPCHDCAITTGFYVPYAEMLLKQSDDIKNKVVDTWFCHNACNRGCAGIRKYLLDTKNKKYK